MDVINALMLVMGSMVYRSLTQVFCKILKIFTARHFFKKN